MCTRKYRPETPSPWCKGLSLLFPFALALTAATGFESCGETFPESLYVSPDGKDTNPGTLSAPLGTLEAARNAIRSLRQSHQLPISGVTVYLRAGVYRRSQTFELDKEDSGTADSPVVYRNYQDETVRLSGGAPLTDGDFQIVDDPTVLQRLPENARGNVRVTDLRSAGITDYGELYQHGFSLPIREAPIELFFDGQPMRLARWPNEGRERIGKVIDRGSNPREGDFSNRGGRFTFDYGQASRWQQAEDIWLHGIFSYGYADDNLKVAQIDLRKKVLSVAQPHIYSLMSSKEGTAGKHLRGYYVYNLLEEIDAPGEYFVDRNEGLLYFYPPSGMEQSEIVVSVVKEPLVSLESVSNVVIQGIQFEYARGMGIYLEGGEHNRISACTFRNLGTVAISMGKGTEGPDGPVHDFKATPVSRKLGNIKAATYYDNAWNRVAGSNHTIEDCLIYNTGTGGIILDGGDRTTLEPGHNVVRNCRIHDYNRWNRTYCPAIELRGVGNRVLHNHIHDAPHQAISVFGNDHLIEFNRIERVCLDADDMGAIYTGRNPSERGTIIRHNGFFDFESDDSRITAIYFDDGAGGGRVYGNLFYRVGHPRFGAIFVHGGHDHLFENNVFVKCKRVFGNTPWTDERWKENVEGELWQKRLKGEVTITEPPYVSKYPELKGFFEPNGRPRVNRGIKNLAYQCDAFSVPQYELQDNLITDEDPGFVDVDKDDFRLKPDSVVFKKIPGFQKIPHEKIGLLGGRSVGAPGS